MLYNRVQPHRKILLFIHKNLDFFGYLYTVYMYLPVLHVVWALFGVYKRPLTCFDIYSEYYSYMYLSLNDTSLCEYDDPMRVSFCELKRGEGGEECRV